MISIQSEIPADSDLLLVVSDGDFTSSEQTVLGNAADAAFSDSKEQEEPVVWYRENGKRVVLIAVDKKNDSLEPWRLAGAKAGTGFGVRLLFDFLQRLDRE